MTEEPSTAEQPPESLLCDVQTVGERFSPEELARCTPDQLAVMYGQLSQMMKSVVDRLVATSNSVP